MNNNLAISVTAIAIALAEKIKNNDELILLSVAFLQLGSTLRTIITEKDLCSKTSEVSEMPSSPSDYYE